MEIDPNQIVNKYIIPKLKLLFNAEDNDINQWREISLDLILETISKLDDSNIGILIPKAIALSILEINSYKSSKYSKILQYALDILNYYNDFETYIELACNNILIKKIKYAKTLEEIIEWHESGVKILKDYNSNWVFEASELFGIKAMEIIEKIIGDASSDDIILLLSCLDKWKSVDKFKVRSMIVTVDDYILDYLRKGCEACCNLCYEDKCKKISCLKCIVDMLEKFKEIDPSVLDDIENIKTSLNLLNIDSGYQIPCLNIENLSLPFFTKPTSKCQISIYKGTYNLIQVAIKKYSPFKNQSAIPYNKFIKISNEIKIYEFLSNKSAHNNCFIKFYGSFIDQTNSVNIIMDYYEENLKEYLEKYKKNNIKLREDQIITVFTKLLQSFNEMAMYHIYHGDIKLQNLLTDGNLNVKIIDFDASEIPDMESEHIIEGEFKIRGSLGYMAPELQYAYDYGGKKAYFNKEKADIFSLGMVFLRFFKFEIPNSFNSFENTEKLFGVIDLIENIFIKNLLKTMLQPDFRLRLNYYDLLTYIENSKILSINS
ncbi:hypothetical protein SteCoe_21691 [Stentor coeruleus]|uniref:Protein kinase domain-containing protein n=1 Tax=Stentor coeruleus TaxID=5963 RepID=A0A1R2BNY8_9CILI|nr:hypothetical protein SteCoe_21691 [Stentor coeruleus]